MDETGSRIEATEEGAGPVTANADKGALVNHVEHERLTGYDRGTLSK